METLNILNQNLFFDIFTISGKNKLLDNFMVFGTEYMIYVTFLLLFIISIKGTAKEKKAFLLSVISLPIMVLIIKTIHIFFFETRPSVLYNLNILVPNIYDASFPSRHTATMAIVAFAYLYYKSKRASLLLFILLWVGLSRIYVGVHYPLDIFGGIIVALFSIVLAKSAIKLIHLTSLRK